MRKKVNITEIRSDYYSEYERCFYIDVWIGDDEDGFSVARVYDSPLGVECVEGREMMFSDPRVQEEILSVIKGILL